MKAGASRPRLRKKLLPAGAFVTESQHLERTNECLNPPSTVPLLDSVFSRHLQVHRPARSVLSTAMHSKTLVKPTSATHGRHSALHWPQSRQHPVSCATVNRSQRSCSTSRPHALQADRNHPGAVIIDIDAVAQGLEVISTAWAFSAAAATAGDIAGSPAVYTRYMQQLLPVLRQPYEAGLMLRLLHEEGVVGEYVVM